MAVKWLRKTRKGAMHIFCQSPFYIGHINAQVLGASFLYCKASQDISGPEGKRPGLVGGTIYDTNV